MSFSSFPATRLGNIPSSVVASDAARVGATSADSPRRRPVLRIIRRHFQPLVIPGRGGSRCAGEIGFDRDTRVESFGCVDIRVIGLTWFEFVGHGAMSQSKRHRVFGRVASPSSDVSFEWGVGGVGSFCSRAVFVHPNTPSFPYSGRVGGQFVRAGRASSFAPGRPRDWNRAVPLVPTHRWDRIREVGARREPEWLLLGKRR
jgi:hypothetical protein